MTPFLWVFEEREKLLEFYERVSGQNACCLYCPGGVHLDIPNGLLNDISIYPCFCNRIDEIEEMLIIIVLETAVGRYRNSSAKEAINYGFTGVMLRGSGLPGIFVKIYLMTL